MSILNLGEYKIKCQLHTNVCVRACVCMCVYVSAIVYMRVCVCVCNCRNVKELMTSMNSVPNIQACWRINRKKYSSELSNYSLATSLHTLEKSVLINISDVLETLEKIFKFWGNFIFKITIKEVICKHISFPVGHLQKKRYVAQQ